jgi:dienelactone hydrolase
MRRPLLAVALAATLLLPALGSAKTFKWTSQGDILTLDPHSQNEGLNIVANLWVYDGLLRYNEKFEITPALATSWEQVAADCQAAIDALGGTAFVAGFCWGGAVAWLAACRCRGVAAASGFYGRMVLALRDETPKAPIILHYGERDAHIPLTDVDAVRAAHPDVPVYLYPAGHGFFSDRSADHDQLQADIAWSRSRALFDAHN